MIFWVLTLFPQMLDCLHYGVVGRAVQQGIVEIRPVDYREYSLDKHKCVDDTPCGGGGGMVLKVEPIALALRSLPAHKEIQPSSETNCRRVVLLSPQGKVFQQADGMRLATYDEVVFVCGRYEGFDERIRAYVHEEISLGDYIVSGGELAAAVLIDAISRHVDGVLGNSSSAVMESHSVGCLEYPQYTRPVTFEERAVPDILMSGHHAEIERWRRKEALRRTFLRRQDLFADLTFEPFDYDLLEELALEYSGLADQRQRWQHVRPKTKRRRHETPLPKSDRVEKKDKAEKRDDDIS